MDALRTAAARVALLIAIAAAPLAEAARYRTENFVVGAATPRLAEEIGLAAEKYRKQLAMEWLGQEMPAWGKPCPIQAKVHPRLGAGGATSFMFDRGEVYGWDMNVQGSRERVLDSVLPHEITHTVFATHFRQPLPRWADEGACTTVEHRSEIATQERMLIRFLKTGQGIPFSDMFAMKEYPKNVMPLYSQGHSLTQFLLERRGKQEFMTFLEDGLRDENWPRAVRKHYGHEGLLDLQVTWLDWVKAGRPRLPLDPDVRIASADQATPQGGVRLATNVTPVTPAKTPAKESVYAAMASGTNRDPQPNATGGSVYDSRSTGTIWR